MPIDNNNNTKVIEHQKEALCELILERILFLMDLPKCDSMSEANRMIRAALADETESEYEQRIEEVF